MSDSQGLPPSNSLTLSSDWVTFREMYRGLLAVVLATFERTHKLSREIQGLKFQKSLLDLLLTSPTPSFDAERIQLQITQSEVLLSALKEQMRLQTEIDALRDGLRQQEIRWSEHFPRINPKDLLEIDPVHCVLNFDLCGSTPAMMAIYRAAGLSGVQQFKARFFDEIRSRLLALGFESRCRIDDEEGDGATLIFAALDDLVTFVDDYTRWVQRKNAEVADPTSPHTRWYRFGACSGPVRYTDMDATSQAFSPANRLQAKSAPGTLLIDESTYFGFLSEANRTRFTRITEPITGKQTDRRSIGAWFWVIDPDAAPAAISSGRWFHAPNACAIPRDALRLPGE